MDLVLAASGFHISGPEATDNAWQWGPCRGLCSSLPSREWAVEQTLTKGSCLGTQYIIVNRVKEARRYTHTAAPGPPALKVRLYAQPWCRLPASSISASELQDGKWSLFLEDSLWWLLVGGVAGGAGGAEDLKSEQQLPFPWGGCLPASPLSYPGPGRRGSVGHLGALSGWLAPVLQQ